MSTSEEPQPFRFEDGSFLALVLVVSIAFAMVIAPFFGAILWALVLALMFNPVHRRILALMPGRTTIAALITLVMIILVVILPAIFLTNALIQEFLHVYALIQSGQINIARMFEQMTGALPDWAASWLRSRGWTDFAAARQQISEALSGSFSAIATHALQFGQGAFNLILMMGVMLYLTFFLVRDGEALGQRVIESIPLDPDRRRAVIRNFTIVTRATIKGSLIVAIVQGVVGGITFALLGIEGALLWGTIMAIFSLIPAIGCGIVWLPVALYLFATGAVVKGVILVIAGALVIGSIDNVLRPLLVGRETRMPDYVVLISTLGGLQIFGFHGFIIGPVVAALFIGTWNIVTEQRRIARR
ncbi:MAG: AI-2E family transporter [Pseudomonadota bacterium]